MDFLRAFSSVCIVRGNLVGNGVFIAPALVLSNFHLCESHNLEIASEDDEIAQPIERYVCPRRDLAMLRLDRTIAPACSTPISGQDISFSSKGWLLTRFRNEAEISITTSSSLAYVQTLLDGSPLVTFKTWAKVQAGYSGSPIFNEQQRIIGLSTRGGPGVRFGRNRYQATKASEFAHFIEEGRQALNLD